MANKNTHERKSFTFLWKIANARYFWKTGVLGYSSPSFEVNEIKGTKWALVFFPTEPYVRLSRRKISSGFGDIEWQVALLAPDGTVLSSSDRKKDNCFSSYQEVDIQIIPLQDTLTISCQIWKSRGEFSEDTQWVSRTRIGVEKRSFLWEIGNFSSLKSEGAYTHKILTSGDSQSEEKCTHEIFKSANNKEVSLDLFLSGGLNSEEIRFAVTPNDRKIKIFIFQVYFVNALGNTIHFMKEEFKFDKIGQRKESSLSVSKAKLMRKSDVLSLQCECEYPSGFMVEESSEIISDKSSFESYEAKNCTAFKENASTNLQKILHNDLKSMLNEGTQSDIKLKTSNKTYPAHKCILSARSPVFKATFSSNMKENINDCVDIEDLSDDTVSLMLRYIYCADVVELDWSSCIQLYEASDKYEILALRDACSTFLRNSLCQKNACEALVIADLHQDSNLKGFVQDFIIQHGDSIIISEEWEKLMETNIKLAADTMRLKFKSGTSK